MKYLLCDLGLFILRERIAFSLAFGRNPYNILIIHTHDFPLNIYLQYISLADTYEIRKMYICIKQARHSLENFIITDSIVYVRGGLWIIC